MCTLILRRLLWRRGSPGKTFLDRQRKRIVSVSHSYPLRLFQADVITVDRHKKSKPPLEIEEDNANILLVIVMKGGPCLETIEGSHVDFCIPQKLPAATSQ
jgi:hypothetical protein